MEFLQLLLVLIALIVIIKKPNMENIALTIVAFSWLFMIYFYIGHKSSALLTIMNL